MRGFTKRTAAALMTAGLLMTAGQPAAAQWYGPGKPGPRAVEVAGKAPSNSAMVLGWSLQGRADGTALVKALQEKPERRPRLLVDLEERGGLKLPEILNLFDGSGFATLAASQSDQPAHCSAWRVAKGKDKALAQWLDKVGEGRLQPGKAGDGQRLWLVGESWSATLGQGWLVVSNSPQGGAALLKDLSGPTVASTAQYKEALKEVPTDNSALALYADAAAWKEGLVAHVPLVSYFTTVELDAWDYAIFSVDFGKKQTDGFVAIETPKTKFADALRAPGGLEGRLVGSLPESSLQGGIDLARVYKALAAARVDSSPIAEMVLGSSPHLEAQSDMLEGFTGSWVGASDLLDTLIVATQQDQVPEPSVRLVGGVKAVEPANRFISGAVASAQEDEDVDQLTMCYQNLKEVGTAMEMWSTDHAGRYPTTLEALVPDHLEAVPSCPVAGKPTYQLETGVKARGNTEGYQDFYSLRCAGHHHPELQADYPRYNGVDGLITGPVAEIAPSEVVPVPSTEATREYEVGGMTVVLDDKAKTATLGWGARGEEWSKSPAAKQPGPVAQTLTWGEDALLGYLYVDYTRVYEAARAAFSGTDATPQDELFLAVVEQAARWTGDLYDVHALKATPTGLRYQGRGFSSTPFFGGTGALAAALFVPNYRAAQQNAQLSGCKNNLVMVATGLEMWAVDHDNVYPETLSELNPDYLLEPPLCPVSRTDTYSASYKKTKKDDGTPTFQLYCAGHNHANAGLPADRPQYDSDQGLLEE